MTTTTTSSSSSQNPSSSHHPHKRHLTNTPPSQHPSATLYNTSCKPQHEASLRCIMDHYDNRSAACETFFAAYRACKKEERARRLAANEGRGFL
mmetsp:Transcript_65545/g.77607  ORF Transcript_65545/g.77607 Transcript_65545/m.77607 type:complete len:94 (+) Transcript_65545:238-519(+)